MTCIRVPWFPSDNARAARLINDIVIGEETDVGPDGSYISHLDLYRRAMRDIGASTLQFDRFCSLALLGVPVEVALARIGAPRHVQAFVTHTMALPNSGSTEEVLAAFFYGREDIIPEMFRRLLNTLYGAKHNDDPAGIALPWRPSGSTTWSAPTASRHSGSATRSARRNCLPGLLRFSNVCGER